MFRIILIILFCPPEIVIYTRMISALLKKQLRGIPVVYTILQHTVNEAKKIRKMLRGI
ncbi:hypothetical protein QW060_06450 [Myroides ceti]|uniref:Uncharacterized protein n=1 Tax=Paenimyroides ceti TaxID=395087 RepID=A0ABT8CS34_9FLAO|nr:hypothetical protein [Paenimyroides ceti]MDN3706771.1 hypothetical protein [Paenimyroides ceti]